MQEKLKNIQDVALKEISNAKTSSEVEEIRVKYLGKKGELTTILRGMKDVSKEERPIIGKMVNEVKAVLESTLENICIILSVVFKLIKR